MIGPRVDVDHTILICAFRYALGRRSPAVGHVADTLHAHRDALPSWARAQVVDDIERAVISGHAGDECDVETWTRVAEDMRKGSSG